MKKIQKESNVSPTFNPFENLEELLKEPDKKKKDDKKEEKKNG